jgi:hypothetical protein
LDTKKVSATLLPSTNAFDTKNSEKKKKKKNNSQQES